MTYPETDLAHNRAGNLSPAQIVRLQQGWQQAAPVMGGFGLALMALGVVFYALGEPLGCAGTWIFAGLLGLLLWGIRRAVRQAQRPGQVARVEGVVRRLTEQDDGQTHYILEVASLRLRMEADDMPRLTDGRTYWVYYLPRTGYLVSAEPAPGS
ncbi:MAG: hypothetical protein HC915_18620 [Anaerolineae bacterium]|nr:hypothetical protein [Anaerolineae bacterium]